MLKAILYYITKALSYILGFFLIAIFILIPTLLFKPDQIIPSIEKDLDLKLSSKYEIVNKTEDWLGFELNQEVRFKYSQEDFNKIVKQIKDKPDSKNGTWIETKNGYTFEINDSFTRDNNYGFESEVDNEERTLYYKYWEY